MTGSGLEFWVAVIAMAVITYLTRALPFLLSARSRLLRRMAEGSSLAALGPALLAGIAAAVIVPDIMALRGLPQWLPYAGGLLATALAARRLGNAGVAVIAGVAVYGVLLALARHAG
ncbi:AzlD domain-containing protein [Bordetella petrii]|uniref:AzlD domain-containing protein n=1 Tax=Bordetella petrii TaxID=94624 RepID=UPI001A96E116|nr:AzlD domain-containing protein [Bordetella petrii]MBO1113369.1 AzlD domain-containing protein [Bordetella petrii]